MIHSYTRQARFVTSVAAMLACASAAQAAPASGKNKTVHIHEIHHDHAAPRVGRAVVIAAHPEMQSSSVRTQNW